MAQIEKLSAEIQTELLANGMSDVAKTLLGQIPSAEALMPPLAMPEAYSKAKARRGAELALHRRNRPRVAGFLLTEFPVKNIRPRKERRPATGANPKSNLNNTDVASSKFWGSGQGKTQSRRSYRLSQNMTDASMRFLAPRRPR